MTARINVPNDAEGFLGSASLIISFAIVATGV
jgi:hypothetical protein